MPDLGHHGHYPHPIPGQGTPLDRDRLTPGQRRLLEELLAVDAPRPPVEPGLAPRLRRRVEEGIAPALELIPDGEVLRLNKTALAALSCDGRFLEHRDAAFAWRPEMFRGKLAHRAIELDWQTDRRHPPDLLVERAWLDLTLDHGSEQFLATLDPMEVRVLRREAEQIASDFRDTWPPIPSVWGARLEMPVAATFGDGVVQVRGKTDLTLGRVRPDRRQMIVVDLKTGWRRPLPDRQDLRLYALLLTLKHGVAPFRLATYYVSESAWDVEDVSVEVLEAAVRQLVDGVVAAARLVFARPPESELRLRPGAYCSWCPRAGRCPALATGQVGAALPSWGPPRDQSRAG